MIPYITYRELLERLKLLDEEQLDSKVVVRSYEMNCGYELKGIAGFCSNRKSLDYLYSPYLTMGFVSIDAESVIRRVERSEG